MLHIQDPTFEDSKILLDTILECCQEAKLGGGAYAYVSSDGATLLIGDPVFEKFLSTGEFELIVGIDDITNTRTLDTLQNYCKRHDNLRVQIFLHNTTGSTFHPKFCWFDCGDYGLSVTGSGNLTQKGMQRNRETFEYTRLSIDVLEDTKRKWSSWLESAAPFLKSLNDENVRARAEENANRMRNQARQRKAEGSTADDENPDIVTTDETVETNTNIDDEIGAWEFDISSRVLIAEITKSGQVKSRWTQANFDKKTFQTYFESTPGVHGQLTLTLRDVKWDGSLGDIKHRPPGSRPSVNFHIELSAERGIKYPDEGRVLGVFVKISSRTFLYMLVFPDHTEHIVLQRVLDKQHRAKPNSLVRYPTDVAELKLLCPRLPILNYLSLTEL
jgi:hypothetical protein